MKSGKYCLGYKQTLKTLRNGKSKLVIINFKMAKGAGSKKAKKSGSNIFAMFSQRQIQEFKEAFGIMDCDKNGLSSEDDLVSAFAAVGKSISSGEASNMLSESPGPVNFTQMA